MDPGPSVRLWLSNSNVCAGSPGTTLSAPALLSGWPVPGPDDGGPLLSPSQHPYSSTLL